MHKDIETKLEEILSLVKKCPENLQEKCFELLFNYYFSNQGNQSKKSFDPSNENPSQEQITPISETTGGDEIKLNQIHTKVRAILKNGELTLDDINNLFYQENSEFKPLYDDLKSTKMADSQIRLTLLGSFENALKDGEFKILVEDVRSLCDTHKCYDSANFATNFKKSKEFFTEEYKKGTTEIALSPAGKKELVKIASEIAR
ncbi:MAG: hypothetical protein PHW82_15090 [Bacteroidales bacterium]|nr:hypothetical protein [Bacteroidales bacterium]